MTNEGDWVLVNSYGKNRIWSPSNDHTQAETQVNEANLIQFPFISLIMHLF